MAEDGGTLQWPSMAALVAGGMVGGGIYVALGVVVEAAGRWAWLAFVIAGIIAVATAHAYAALSNHFGSGGGAFEFLEEMDRGGAAGSLSWVLLAAYTLTISLYAFAFGAYVAEAFGQPETVARMLSLGVLAALLLLNLQGIGKLQNIEIVIVTANLLVLVALGVAGVAQWDPPALVGPDGAVPVWRAGMGAAAVFVSYEGFQLLTYEYDEVEDPQRTLGPVLVWSSTAVVAIYALVAVGATMLAGSSAVIEQGTVALSVAADALLGTPGVVVMTVAAAFATTAAINSTLFSTAQLAGRVAEDGELPAVVDHRNDADVPDRAMIGIVAVAAVLVWVGSLSALVEAASLAFLAAFGAVNIIALREGVGRRWVAITALAVGGTVGLVLLYRLATQKPIALGVMVVVFAVAFGVRPWLLRHARTEDEQASGQQSSGATRP